MSVRIPQHILRLEAYKPGRPIAEVLKEYGLDRAIKLASNENPLGASPKAMNAIAESIHDIASYPNGGRSLREVLATKHGLRLEEVIAGAGSEGVMETFMRTFLQEGDEVITSEGTFVGFYVIAHTLNVDLKLIPLREHAYDLDAITDAITPRTKLIYIANPNNPTGSYINRADFEAFYARVPKSVIVMHDEAYYDFATAEADDYPSYFTDIRPNLVTLRTFSKSHGLAGIRIGYGSGPAELVLPALKVKLPFEPNSLAQIAGIAALEDTQFLERTIEVNRAGKRVIAQRLLDMEVRFLDTYANFFCLIFDSRETALQITEHMERHGVILRHLGGFGLPECVRFSIGTPEQNELALEALSTVMEELELAL